MSASSSAMSTRRVGTSATRDTPIDLDIPTVVATTISLVGTLGRRTGPRIPTGRGTELKPPTVWVRIPPGARHRPSTSQRDRETTARHDDVPARLSDRRQG